MSRVLDVANQNVMKTFLWRKTEIQWKQPHCLQTMIRYNWNPMRHNVGSIQGNISETLPWALKTLGSVGCLWCLPALTPALTHEWELARCTTVHACLSTLTGDNSQVKFCSPFQDLRGSQPALTGAILKGGFYEKEVANGGVAWSLFHISETFVSSASSQYLSLYLSSLVSYTKLVADFCRLMAIINTPIAKLYLL